MLKNIMLPKPMLLWALLVTILLWFSACSKKSTDVVSAAASLQGVWRVNALTIDPAYDLIGTGVKTNDVLTAYKVYLGGQAFVDCFKSVTWTFNTSGTITTATTAACSSIDASLIGKNASWVLTDSKLKITDGTDVNEFDVSVSGTTLKLSQPVVDDFDNDGKDDSATMTLELVKV